MTDITPEQAGQNFQIILTSAAQLPGVRIERNQYLKSVLERKFPAETVEKAIMLSPAAAGISPDQLSSIADNSIRYEATKVTALSAAAGIPGGLAMFGTVPADLAQYFAHIIRITQKLAYLYGWESIFENNDEAIDDEAKNLLILFIGIMFGVNSANGAIAKISQAMAVDIAKRLPRTGLTKGAIYPVVKSVARVLGVRMTTQIFSNGISKAIPVIGGIVSGGITLATYTPMCFKLKDYLAQLETANPATYSEIEVEYIEEPSTQS